jgi:serine/threonine-protein kinase
MRSIHYQDYQAAADLYQRAVDLDPNFALAQVGLGKAHTEIFWFSGDRTSRRLELAKEALDRALALDPQLPEAHGALGLYHYHGFLDYDRALQQFAIALRGEPSNAEFHANRAWVLRRQGKLDECIASYERALVLDPQAHVWASDLAYTYAWVGRYADAHLLLDRTLDYAPDYPLAYVFKATAHALEGELENARQVLRRGIETLGLDELLNDLSGWDAVLLDAESRDQVEGLRLSPRISDTTNYYLAKAVVSRERNDLARARALFDSAAVTARVTAEANPLGPALRMTLALALAGAGHREAAITEARHAVDLLPIASDKWDGPVMVLQHGNVYLLLGETDQAIQEYQRVVSVPGVGHWYRPLFRHHPFYDSLREQPRFRALIEGGQ